VSLLLFDEVESESGKFDHYRVHGRRTEIQVFISAVRRSGLLAIPGLPSLSTDYTDYADKR
jgi:hypothetical protein